MVDAASDEDVGAAFVASTDDATDRYADITAAFASLPNGGVVKLGPGPFHVSQTVVIPGGCQLRGQGMDLGVDNVAPARGSWVVAGAGFPVDTSSAVVQVGQDATTFASGACGAAIDHVIVDAAGIAAIAIKTFGRRTYTTYCQAWRATVVSLSVQGQNSYVIDSWASGNNRCTPMRITGGDSKVIRCQIRQAGRGLPQVLVTGNNVEFGQCHVYGGADGTVAGTGISDDLIYRPTGTDIGHFRCVDNTFDGTNGNSIHIIINGATRARDIIISNNTIYGVTGQQAATFYVLKIDVTQDTFATAIRELVFTGNVFNNNIASIMWRALIGVYSKGSGAAIERFEVDNNMGSNARLFVEGYTMRIDASSGTTTGSATVTDAAITNADAGMPVTGPGIPVNSFVGPVAGITAGTSFKLSSNPTTQVDVLATATATVSINVGALSTYRPDFLGESNGLGIGTSQTPARTGQRGVSTQSGTGAKTAFTIAHGLGFLPAWLEATPGSAAAAAAPFFVTADATNLTVTFTTAPPAGTGNVVVNWRAAV